ncbi:unnamed protein product [Lactuca virosa]|uniref:Peptidase A2 domain-containing protein n=1 Tax=Lactuca virosa TaxID=75947 RepID=A0AAU9MHU3_9ASTR|nr:unnamed protein product [Lactuca virosa]
MEKLRWFHQGGTIFDYIKEFTTIMLEIEDLSDRDALFYFKDGLCDWDKTRRDGDTRRVRHNKASCSFDKTSVKKADKEKGIRFVDVSMNGKESVALVDTGASQKFLDTKEAEIFGVRCLSGSGTVKVVNSGAKKILGTTIIKVRIDN